MAVSVAVTSAQLAPSRDRDPTAEEARQALRAFAAKLAVVLLQEPEQPPWIVAKRGKEGEGKGGRS
jgi:hypothetical protein